MKYIKYIQNKPKNNKISKQSSLEEIQNILNSKGYTFLLHLYSTEGCLWMEGYNELNECMAVILADSSRFLDIRFTQVDNYIDLLISSAQWVNIDFSLEETILNWRDIDEFLYYTPGSTTSLIGQSVYINPVELALNKLNANSGDLTITSEKSILVKDKDAESYIYPSDLNGIYGFDGHFTDGRLVITEIKNTPINKNITATDILIPKNLCIQLLSGLLV